MKFSNCLAGQFLISDHHNSHQQVSLPPLKRSAYQASEGTVLPNFFFFYLSRRPGHFFFFDCSLVAITSDHINFRFINFTPD